MTPRQTMHGEEEHDTSTHVSHDTWQCEARHDNVTLDMTMRGRGDLGIC